MQVTSSDIKKALAKKHRDREFFITECKNGPTGTGLLQFDGLAIYKSWAHPNIVGYEIKVSRSDFLRDNKFFRYMPYCHELYFVVPTGLIDRMELPNDIGLMYYNPETKALTTKKKAIHRKIEVDANMLLYIIMNRLDSDRLPFHSTQAEYWRDWLDNKISNRELGWQVKSKLLNQIRELEQENQRYRHFKEERDEYNKILEVMKKHGLNTWYNVAETLDKALSRPYPAELDTVLNQLQAAVKEIDKLKAKEAHPDE
ncbi:MmcB family DNA repair protein [Tepidibacillus marianensis]|uniref:MmcB family DNA repair protein n=1 Tax=Tepidibacillus marianensis TaxID=3131995 RepID=UPI0030D3A3F4